jgi:hypothetical protein
MIAEFKTQTPERGGNDGRMESEENHKTVSLPSHRPWKSLTRFPHSHRADDRFLFPQNQNLKEFPATDLPSSVQAHSSMRKCWRGGLVNAHALESILVTL